MISYQTNGDVEEMAAMAKAVECEPMIVYIGDVEETEIECNENKNKYRGCKCR